MTTEELRCIECDSAAVVKFGKSGTGEQRYRCQALACKKTFQLMHRYKACDEGIKDLIIDMTHKGYGIRSTAKRLSVATGTVITTIRKTSKH